MVQWNGVRAGWNTRGGSTRQHMQVIKDMQEDTSPNAQYWKIEATTELTKLANKIGRPEYKTWFEKTWPGASVNTESWKEIFQTAHSYLIGLEKS